MSKTIQVETENELPEGQFLVTVKVITETIHTVTLKELYYIKLTGGTIPPEELIRRSFEFLLEREPNTSILREFNLEVISQYFPEYEKTIRAQVSN